jgi:putative transposase
MAMFRRDSDFEAFERVIVQALERHPIRILSYCLMSTHWHFVVWPEMDDQVTRFFRWLTHTHAMRWRVSHHTVGYGHLYQGRFKSFPVESDGHLLALCRYVERNPVAAGMVERAEQWRWGSLWIGMNGDARQKSMLAPWPVDRPSRWTQSVNRPLNAVELEMVETSLTRCSPLGGPEWTDRIARELSMQHTLRREGRPKNG